jgi:phage gpG-like protein
MSRLQIQIDDRQVLDVLGQLVQRLGTPGPALKLIGETLAESTKQRFSSSRAPGGSPWAANTETTLERYLGRFAGSRTKTGARSTKGQRRAAGKKPLIGETKALSTTITYQVVGDTLYVGSPMEYAGTQQAGARRGQYGRTRRGAPIPWGDIPPRPFLGLSDTDRTEVLATLREILAGQP